MNELILVASMLAHFSLILLAYRFFGKAGLYAMAVFCTVSANIEVMILVRAFGLDQTLGNILFACTFVITDILSENHSKKDANKAAKISVFVTATFMITTQSWLLYTPAAEDTVMGAVRTLFSNTPRVMLSSLAVCALTQLFDVWLYHRVWDFTSKKFGDSKKFLWLRNNIATLTSQLINAVLFTLGAFAGVYSIPVLISVTASSYVIFAVVALCDTPIVYLARKIKARYDIS